MAEEQEETVSKAKYDAAIKSMNKRISELSTEKKEIQAKFDEASSKIALTENLQSQVSHLQSELKTANTRYDRHSSLAELGINDGSVRSAFEFQYSQLQGDPPPFNEWLQGLSSKPEEAPLILQSYLKKETPADPSAQLSPADPRGNPPANPNPPPASNNGVQAVPVGQMTNEQILKRGQMDPKFYREHRDTIVSLIQTGQRPTAQRVDANSQVQS
jgi:hypothetical protein